MSHCFLLCLFWLNISQVLAQVCFPKQLEGLALLDYGEAFKADADSQFEQTTYSYTNGTVRISYDYTNLRLYMNINATVYSSQPDQSGPISRLYLQDYKKGVEYYVTGGKCVKSKLTTNMTSNCIPVGAKNSDILIVGLPGHGSFAVNYEFEKPDFMKVSMTLGPGNVPINVVYYSDIPPMPNFISYLYSLQFIDSSVGIKDTSVFDVPDICKGITQEHHKLFHRTSAYICCTPDQWDAFLYFDYGNVFIDEEVPGPHTAYSVINGTIKLSYDYENQRLYMFVNGTEYSPLIPQPVPDTSVFLYDYKQGIEYQVTNGKCDKSRLDSNMTRQCVPDDANLVMKGPAGDGDLKTDIYEFSQTTPLELQVSATVLTDSCIPLHVVYHSNPGPSGSGIMVVLEPVDVSPGIHDPSVFDVPEPCRTA